MAIEDDLMLAQDEETQLILESEALQQRINDVKEKTEALKVKQDAYKAQIKRNKAPSMAVLLKQISVSGSHEDREACEAIIADARDKLTAYTGKIKTRRVFKTHKCMVCSKMLSSTKSLEEHSRIHTKELLPCLSCHKSFVRKRALTKHTKEFHNPNFNAAGNPAANPTI